MNQDTPKNPNRFLKPNKFFFINKNSIRNHKRIFIFQDFKPYVHLIFL